jgi:hypothetical protein
MLHNILHYEIILNQEKLSFLKVIAISTYSIGKKKRTHASWADEIQILNILK